MLRSAAGRLGRTLTAPLRKLGPSAGRSGPAINRRTGALVLLAIVLANIIGAAVVFAFALLVTTPNLVDDSEVRLANGIAFGAYVAFALAVGIVWGVKRMGPLRAFLREDRDPTPEERALVIRAPLRLTTVNGCLWGLAVFVFGALNLTFSAELAGRVVASVLLAGVVTSAFVYLLSERLMRAVAARALAAEAPTRPMLPGVAARSILAWTLGTGLALLGLMSIAISTLVEEDFSRDQLAVVVLVIAGIAFFAGLLLVTLSAKGTADPIRSVRDALAEVERGELGVEVPVYDASEVGMLQAGFNRMVEGLRERERIRDAFGTYIDRDVAERILEEGPSLEGEQVEVTVMFLDVRDFTGYAEKRDPPEVVSTLNRLFERAVPIVHRRGGLVDKFVGDGLLAVFGALRGGERHADSALEAALELVPAIEEEFGGEIEVGIGLNSGPVVVGNVGGAGRLEFSVIGDAVNVAARVEAATRETGDVILISENTAELLGDRDDLEPRSGVELKGKSEPVALFAPGAAARIAVEERG